MLATLSLISATLVVMFLTRNPASGPTPQTIDCFDAHFHILDPAFPLIPSQGYIPPYFTIADYQSEMAQTTLRMRGGSIVSGSFQGFDQTYLESAIGAMGSFPHKYMCEYMQT
jgi:hypothetical protein